jgi:hypothetical protein
MTETTGKVLLADRRKPHDALDEIRQTRGGLL